MDYNTPEYRESIIKDFKQLQFDSAFYVYSPPDFNYNCIAWAMGMSDRWGSHDNVPWAWWPPTVKKNGHPESLINAFKYFGFEICDNGIVEDGFDKVALYQKNGLWQHAAKIIDNGVYYSKFGCNVDAHHGPGNILFEGYGEIYAYMKRPYSQRHITDDIKGTPPPGRILVSIPGLHYFICQGIAYSLDEKRIVFK